MKRVLSVSAIVLFCLYTLLPVCMLISLLTDYQLTVRGALVCALVLFAFSLFQVLPSFFLRGIAQDRVSNVFSIPLLPLGILSWFKLIAACDYSGMSMLLALFSLVCLAMLLFRSSGKTGWKLASGAAAVLLAIPLAFGLLIGSVFGNFGENTVVREIKSPNGSYVAQVVDSDQGALGGNTLVEVRAEEKTVDLLVVRFTKRPIRVYTGAWGEFDTLPVEWQDETTLLIKGHAYRVGGK